MLSRYSSWLFATAGGGSAIRIAAETRAHDRTAPSSVRRKKRSASVAWKTTTGLCVFPSIRGDELISVS
ncbi:MAG: hypothetical protein CME06_07605 [Gemmatimonadetes bacterium]|nr:hypothetical protein [Gemmatimonadota bacterium]